MSINLTTYAPIVQVCWKHFRQKTWFRSFFKIIIISKLKILKCIESIHDTDTANYLVEEC